jgi:hypothetical protein
VDRLAEVDPGRYLGVVPAEDPLRAEFLDHP